MLGAPPLLIDMYWSDMPTDSDGRAKQPPCVYVPIPRIQRPSLTGLVAVMALWIPGHILFPDNVIAIYASVPLGVAVAMWADRRVQRKHSSESRSRVSTALGFAMGMVQSLLVALRDHLPLPQLLEWSPDVTLHKFVVMGMFAAGYLILEGLAAWTEKYGMDTAPSPSAPEPTEPPSPNDPMAPVIELSRARPARKSKSKKLSGSSKAA